MIPIVEGYIILILIYIKNRRVLYIFGILIGIDSWFVYNINIANIIVFGKLGKYINSYIYFGTKYIGPFL